MTLHGAWADAVEEIERACVLLSRPPGHPAIGLAFGQRADLCRLRGDFAAAERAYQESAGRGGDPQPGLSLLRLAQGRTGSAAAAIRRALDNAGSGLSRARLLPAQVEISLAAGDPAAARTGLAELDRLAVELDAPVLLAAAAYCLSAVLLAEGSARESMSAARRAWVLWQGIDAPYEAARCRVLMAAACRRLGDPEAAAMELEAAGWVFAELGAAPDVKRIAAPSQSAKPGSGPLTDRELQVLRLLATGMTNRAIAGELFVSEKTVARHVSNIFGKLAVTTRSAATAYAFAHDLAGGRTT
jgi:DNA-binding CsgD family transcriptional regulator